MGGNSVKTIVLLMVLVVLSLVVGAQVSDSLKDSIGAFVIIGTVVMLFALIFLGRNAWWLIFLLSPALHLLPLRMLSGALGLYALGGVILVYNMIQGVFLRQQKITWHKLAPFDALFFIIAVYMCISYYRFPVSVDMISEDAEYVGAEVYIHWLGTVVYFFCLSSLSIKSEELEKILRIAFFVTLGFAVLNVGVRLLTGDIYWKGGDSGASLGEEMGERRITLLCPLAGLLIPYIYASRPMFALMCSPVRIAGVLFSLYGISLSGSRGLLVGQALNLVGISFLKKEFAAAVVMGIAMCGGLLLLSANGTLQNLPKTAQRMVSIIPGIQVDHQIEYEAGNSSDIRVVAWKMAFDVRAGYIKDYIWGDGFQVSRQQINRTRVALMRGIGQKAASTPDVDSVARSGNWHNGFISTMHRLGLVGCALFYGVMIYFMVLFFVVGFYYRGKAFFPYYCCNMSGLFAYVFAYSYNANDPTDFFGACRTYCLLKLLYVLLRKEGKLAPISLRRNYVPILIRELNDSEAGHGHIGRTSPLRVH